MTRITLGNWQHRMSQDMRLVDYRPRTQEAYLLATRLFLEHVGREPEDLSEDDVRAYALHLRDERQQSASYRNIAVCALRFFFQRTLGCEWPVFDLLRVQKPKTLPEVLSKSEVRGLLAQVRHPQRRVALTTIYGLGLRLGEALRLETSHLDSERLVVAVRSGKGAKDRTVPLPRPLLQLLRAYWRSERPASSTHLLFPAASGERAIDETTLQKTFTAAMRESRLQKHATIHTLRHSYATHLVEAGVSLRVIQSLLGHAHLRTTEVYLHVTTVGSEHVQQAVDLLLTDLLAPSAERTDSATSSTPPAVRR